MGIKLRYILIVGLFVITAFSIGGGIVFQSYKSAPTDSLYSIKLSVIEPFTSSLYLKSYKKAGYYKTLIGKRLEEIRTSPQPIPQLQTILANIEKNTTLLKNTTENIKQSGRLPIAVEILTDTETLLKAHEMIFTARLNDAQGDVELTSIIALLQDMRDELGPLRFSLETLFSQATKFDEKQLGGVDIYLRETTAVKLITVQTELEQNQKLKEHATRVDERVITALETVQDTLNKTEFLLREKRYIDAFSLLVHARATVEEAAIIVTDAKETLAETF